MAFRFLATAAGLTFAAAATIPDTSTTGPASTSAAVTTTTAAVAQASCPGETMPWTISNLQIFQAAPNCSEQSYVCFHFCDQNTGIALDTDCTRNVAPGGALVDPNTYYDCDNDAVSFAYGGDTLEIARWFVNDWQATAWFSRMIEGC
ncbi:hypothetical protein BAUCODRAFT_35525 [Baudoinia panamericana UAMH 10762]|uniref:Cyanovirin-N domain-containing protein n=1 Tax=Baudoinia panamericana (strain UAMH 10762) TaxID=717646 RepID=M2N5L9_BAUPA|nr:uncharacterized protein BAUCODRAFT_35525 [Baudoinia panamericana UAMH 10762]EMC94339.1 hypothetical protein BAUCODRAFT_35525 [Baudoinia panamericana UAMH 10762]